MIASGDIEAAGVRAALVSQPTTVEYAATILLPDGDRAAYDPASHPAQLCIYQAADAGYTSITIVKPVQDGGSLASFVLILRRIHALAQTGIIAYPTMSAAKDAWTTKLWPMLSAQGGTIPSSGGGSRGGASSVVTLPSGGRCILRAAGGRGESGQASATADVLMDDETDDWPSMRTLQLIERRINKSQDPLIVHVSTVKRDGEGAQGSHILRLYASGSQTRIHYACPHCGVYQAYELEMISYEHRALTCGHCDALINERDRISSLRNWKRVDGSKSRRFSILWTALDSPFPIMVSGVRYPVLDGLAEEWLQAESQIALGDHGFARQYYRDRFCRQYKADLVTDDHGHTVIPTRNRLAALSSASGYGLAVDRTEPDGDSLHFAEIPSFVEHITVAADVQRGGENAPGRLYFKCLGRGGGRGAAVGWGSVIACPKGRQPTIDELHHALTRLDGIMRDWAPLAPVVRRGVDVGDRQDEIRKWLRSHPTWLAIKGTGPLKAMIQDHPGWIYKRQQDDGWMLYLIETKSALSIVHGEIMAAKEVGSMALPRGLTRTSALITHICATVEMEPGKWSTSAKDRMPSKAGAPSHPEWQTRDDYGQCAAYARALAYDWETKPRQTVSKRKYGNLGDVA